MTRRRNGKNNQGLLEFAVRSDWKACAGLAVITVYVGAALVPALLGDGTVLQAIGTVIAQFAWLTAFVLAFIAIVRFREPPTAAGTLRLVRDADEGSEQASHASACHPDVAATASPR